MLSLMESPAMDLQTYRICRDTIAGFIVTNRHKLSLDYGDWDDWKQAMFVHCLETILPKYEHGKGASLKSWVYGGLYLFMIGRLDTSKYKFESRQRYYGSRIIQPIQPDTISQVQEVINKAMRSLKPRERKYISEYMSRNVTLEEFALREGVSKQRIGQVVTKAYNRMRDTLSVLLNK